MGRFNLSEIDIIRHSSNKLWKTFKDWKVIFLWNYKHLLYWIFSCNSTTLLPNFDPISMHHSS